MTAATSLNRFTPTAHFGTDVRTCDTLSAALQTAGIAWGIEEHPAKNLTLLTDDGVTSTSIPDRKLLLRSDNHTTLGVVGNRYQPVDNAAAFGMADAAHRLGAQFAYAGEIHHGRTTFLEMALPEATVNVGGNDLVHTSLIFTTNHAGEGGITGEVKLTREVCTNGMRATMSSPATWNIRHTFSADSRLELAEESLQHATAHAKEFAAAADHMISTPMTLHEFDSYITALFPLPEEDASDRKHTIWQNRREQLVSLFRHTETQEDARNTAWAGYNAVVEWLDWYKSAKGGESGRALRNFSSSSDAIGNRAFQLVAA